MGCEGRRGRQIQRRGDSQLLGLYCLHAPYQLKKGFGSGLDWLRPFLLQRTNRDIGNHF